MQNSQTFMEEVENCLPIRDTLNSELSGEMRDLRRLFVNAFSVEAKEFTFLKDSLYYKGGYPSENSPARLDTLFQKVGVITKWLSFLGLEDEYDKYCKQYGFVVHPLLTNTALSDNGFEDRSDFKILWQDVFGTANHPSTKKEILQELVDRGLQLQGTICQEADKIKIDHAEIVEEICQVPKNVFVKTVNNMLKKRKGAKNIEDRLNEQIEKSLVTTEALTIVAADVVNISEAK
jgi:hypothetical protein